MNTFSRFPSSQAVILAFAVATACDTRTEEFDHARSTSAFPRIEGPEYRVITKPAAKLDTSPPLASTSPQPASARLSREVHCGAEPDCALRSGSSLAPPISPTIAESHALLQPPAQPPAPYVAPPVAPQSAAIEQTEHGARPPIMMIESFDGHGFGLVGPHGAGRGNNPSDNSLAVGPNHIYETVNSLTAIYTKKGELFDTTGKVLFGPIGHNVVWNGFGGECERSPNGDTVVRYDQLAGRWLIVMPRFNRAPPPPNSPPGTQGPYGMCYAVSTGPSPMGPYYRYYFERELFPDYPRPAIWPDGYYVPTSTGDDVIEKHACVVDRARMLAGEPATEQCIIVPDVNFLNNADIDGKGLPPAGAPNIMIATGGTQLRRVYRDDGIYVWKFHVDWRNTANTRLEGPSKITVAPYDYLCDGQLTRCVPQPETQNRLDAQGDKIMQRVVYRNIEGRESIVAVHSVNTASGAGGVRWYEFRLDQQRDLVLRQQGTFAPTSSYRWMASPGMDRQGNIGFGFSYGSATEFPGQRFVARLADDTLGRMTFRETVMVEGGASQTTNLRWQDYTTTAMDPSDDCTFWYQGDYWKAGATGYTVRIGAFRVPGCRRGTVSGSVFYDSNRNGMRDPNESGMPGWSVDYTAVHPLADSAESPAGTLTTDGSGDFSASLSADPAYYSSRYRVTAREPDGGGWSQVRRGTGYSAGGPIDKTGGAYLFDLNDRDVVARLDFGIICNTTARGGGTPAFWSESSGAALLAANDPAPVPPDAAGARGRGRAGRGGRGGPPAWRPIVNTVRFLVTSDGRRFAVPATAPFDSAHRQLAAWLQSPSENRAHLLSIELAAASFGAGLGRQDDSWLVLDTAADEWVPLSAFLARVSTFIAQNPVIASGGALTRVAELYHGVLAGLNRNTLALTPSSYSACTPPAAR